MTPMEIDAIEKKFEDAFVALDMASDYQDIPIRSHLEPIIEGIQKRMAHIRNMNTGEPHPYTITQMPGASDNYD